MNAILKFLRDEDGTTAVEYAVMLALLILTMLVSIAAFGGNANAWWGNINTELQTYGF